MIKANELRIGNKVIYENTLHDIESLSKLYLLVGPSASFGQKTYRTVYEELEPIPLTPEILEACGFSSDLDGVQKKSIHKFYDYQIMTVGLMDSFYLVQHGSAGIMPPCQYLHQLQNLFYCLTGEELKYNGNGNQSTELGEGGNQP